MQAGIVQATTRTTCLCVQKWIGQRLGSAAALDLVISPPIPPSKGTPARAVPRLNTPVLFVVAEAAVQESDAAIPACARAERRLRRQSASPHKPSAVLLSVSNGPRGTLEAQGSGPCAPSALHAALVCVGAGSDLSLTRIHSDIDLRPRALALHTAYSRHRLASPSCCSADACWPRRNTAYIHGSHIHTIPISAT